MYQTRENVIDVSNLHTCTSNEKKTIRQRVVAVIITSSNN